jgi:hypothetical protein
MALNHLGLALPALWPTIGVAFGRVSLPIFALLIVFHLQRDTEARAGRYLGLLLFWGLLTQPVYALLIANWQSSRGNAMLTLASGVCLIYLARIHGIVLAGLATAIVIGGSVWLDGGAWMPVVQLLAWYLLTRSPGNQALALALVAVVAFAMNVPAQQWVSIPALVGLLGTPLLVLASPHLSGYLPRLPQLAFYSFYPLHLAAILALHGAY